ncbi:MAG: helix-turn-helix domain-containing protein [Acetobacteraceae bacterium]|nr:helix-turn-helix domain-containing protein [Acetobacteraceae bacterium]
MLRVDHQRWDQTVADLRDLALSAVHPRSRERFLALHEIAAGSCATAVAERTGRRAQTVMGWLHVYNDHGPEALTDQRSGGRPPFVPISPPRWASRSAPRNIRQPARQSPERR